MLGDLGQAGLVRGNAHLPIVGLRVNEVRKQLVELHGWEVSSKHVQVALEGEANAERVRVGED